MRKRLSVAQSVILVLVLFAASCGDDDSDPEDIDEGAVDLSLDDEDESSDDSEGVGEAAGPLPDECVIAPTTLTIEGEGVPIGSLDVVSGYAKPIPIVPNGDGSLDDLGIAEMNDLGAETDLLLYTIYLSDFEIDPSSISNFSGPSPDEGTGDTTIGFTVVPTSEHGIATGDVITAEDELAYDPITTFAPMGVFFESDAAPDGFFSTSAPNDGTVEVLHLSEDYLCLAWTQSGDFNDGEASGTWSIDAVVAAEMLDRSDLPFT